MYLGSRETPLTLRSQQRRLKYPLANSIHRFKKLALRHHPLKNPAEMNINLQKFHEICEAYEVLSNRKLLRLVFLI
jgi:DnaJ domain